MWIVVVVRPSFGTGENGVNDVLQLFFSLDAVSPAKKKKKIPPPPLLSHSVVVRNKVVSNQLILQVSF